MAVPQVRIHVCFPFVDLGRLDGDSSPLDWHANSHRIQLPGERPFVRGVGQTVPATGAWGSLPGAPRVQVDASRLIGFSIGDSSPSSGVLRANVIRRSLVAESDGISGVAMMEFAWASRRGRVHVDLHTLTRAVDRLQLEIDHREVSVGAARKVIGSALESRLRGSRESKGLRTSRPMLLIEATTDALSTNSVTPSHKLALRPHGSIYSVQHDRWDIFVIMKARQLARFEPVSPGLMLIHGISGAISAISGEPPSQSVRAALMSRVRTLRGMGNVGVTARWPVKLVTFYDSSHGNSLSSAISRIAQEDQQFRQQAEGTGMTLNFNGDINTQGGDFMAGINVTKQNAQIVDNAGLVRALEIIAQSNAANHAHLEMLLSAARKGEDKGTLRTLWESAKGALQAVGAAVPAIEAVSGFLAS